MSIFKRKNNEEEQYFSEAACETENISNKGDEYLSSDKFDKEKINISSYDDNDSLESKISSFIENFKKETKGKKFTKRGLIREIDNYLFDKMAICPKCQFHKYTQIIDNDIDFIDKTILINVNKYNYCVGGISDYPVKCSSKTIECNSFKLKEE
jgi:hypothetical protein